VKEIYGRRRHLGNVMDLMEDFEKEIKKEKIRRVQVRKEKRKEKTLNLEVEVLKRSKLLENHTVKILFG